MKPYKYAAMLSFSGSMLLKIVCIEVAHVACKDEIISR